MAEQITLHKPNFDNCTTINRKALVTAVLSGCSVWILPNHTGKWIVIATNPTFTGMLITERGTGREFASLDTAVSYLGTEGIRLAGINLGAIKND